MLVAVGEKVVVVSMHGCRSGGRLCVQRDQIEGQEDGVVVGEAADIAVVGQKDAAVVGQ